MATTALSGPQSPDLSIRIICERAKAGWPLASTLVGLCWSCVYMLSISATHGEVIDLNLSVLAVSFLKQNIGRTANKRQMHRQ